MTSQENSAADIAARFGKTIQTAMKLKKVMLKRGIVSACTPCPFCGDGKLHGRLAGRRSHLRMWCDACDIRMME